MPLFDENAEKKTNVARESRFVRLVTGMPTVVQILEHDSVAKYQHWLTTSDGKRVSVRCTGFLSCPVCARNASIDNDRDNPKYVASQRRYMINVIDLTMVKRSPNTGEIFIATKDTNGRFIYSDRDSAGNSLVDVVAEPWKAVKVLEGGPRLFKKLQSLAETTLGSDGTPRDPTAYPLQIVRVGDGRDTDYLLSALVGNAATVNPADYTDQVIDLRADSGFTRDEVEAILSGTTIKDIFAARVANTQSISDDLFDLELGD
jgi:hypothetical protein